MTGSFTIELSQLPHGQSSPLKSGSYPVSGNTCCGSDATKPLFSMVMKDALLYYLRVLLLAGILIFILASCAPHGQSRLNEAGILHDAGMALNAQSELATMSVGQISIRPVHPHCRQYGATLRHTHCTYDA